MWIKFWGVRGSIPTPLTPANLQQKISAIVQRIEPADLVSQESRETFLANLPLYLFDTVGGNTTCVEIRLSDDTLIVMDAGSGIRGLGNSLKRTMDRIKEIHIFFTHFHWDHIQGLPFFAPPVFNPKCTIKFYSPVKGFENIVRRQMRSPYFPITMNEMAAKLEFIEIRHCPVTIRNANVFCRGMKHPGGSFSYKVVEEGKSAIFSTDTELTEADFKKDEKNTRYFENTDLLIVDSQYTLDEAIEKYDWGHSSYSLAVDFASEWGIKKLVLFHHEPQYADKKVYNILKSSRWYLRHLENKQIDIHLATESLEIEL
jgi:phosphoribosyl 1,2-cyclic phosphodiesterase